MFRAVVMSTGGIVSRETADEMRRWRKEMGPAAFEGMMRKISLKLVRARARTFAILLPRRPRRTKHGHPLYT
ncbi:hypothetical protein C366_01460 [Cryptococcus neoformans Tu401-1]|nr:hypothetical protein C365_01657 [Cryptococcus neoformans var. grubii Bt85]OXG21775.1 hypothetical protein C366_01460 [Cryptococcus neoformans var. grubii Tu401-1]